MSPSLRRDVFAFGLALGFILTGCSRKPPVAKTHHRRHLLPCPLPLFPRVQTNCNRGNIQC